MGYITLIVDNNLKVGAFCLFNYICPYQKARLVFKYFTFFVLICLLPWGNSIVFAQTGGNNTYEFLNIPPTARLASLGGNNVSVLDNDPGFVYANPALMRESMHESLSLNYNNYIADINFAYASYTRNFEGVGTFGAGIYYLNYGDFIHADETGAILGNFTASDYVFGVSYSRPLGERLYMGSTLKFMYSSMYAWFSSGVAVDVGIHYFSADSLFSVGGVIKNAGTQLKPYYQGQYEKLPFDVQVGVSQRLRHAPFRFSITMQDLMNWSLRYNSPFDNTGFDTGNQSADTATLAFSEKLNNFFNAAGRAGDELLRHAVVGVEILPSPNFYISLGFNYRRRAELAMSTRQGLIGFSVGAGIRISKINIAYGFANYHMAGKSHLISLSTNLNDFYRKSSL